MKYAEKGQKEISSSDLRELMNQVGCHVKDNWRPVGSELGLSVADLNSIDDSKQGNAIQCISEVFSKWIRSQSKTPVNWQTLLVSLCKPQVERKDIADKVYQEFLKGNC